MSQSVVKLFLRFFFDFALIHARPIRTNIARIRSEKQPGLLALRDGE